MVSFSMNMERIECVGFSVTCILRGKQAAVESSQFYWIGFQVVRAKSSMLVIVREHCWQHCWNYMNQLNRQLVRSRAILLKQLHPSKRYLAGLSIWLVMDGMLHFDILGKYNQLEHGSLLSCWVSVLPLVQNGYQ